MPKTLHLKLNKRAMAEPVTHSVNVRGELLQSGVDVWFWSDGQLHLALIADGAENKGVSVTNGYGDYAAVLQRQVGESISVRFLHAIQWFEFDSMGYFDEVRLTSGEAEFLPLLQPGRQPRSADGFLAKMTELAPASREFWAGVLDQLFVPYGA